VLEVTFLKIFDEKPLKVINQTNNENPSVYNVENMCQDSKDVYEKLIDYLQEEIIFLRKQLEDKKYLK